MKRLRWILVTLVVATVSLLATPARQQAAHACGGVTETWIDFLDSGNHMIGQEHYDCDGGFETWGDTSGSHTIIIYKDCPLC